MNEAARKLRDERFRRGVVTALDLAREHAPDKCLSGVTLADNANSALSYDQKVEDEKEAMRLIRDVCDLGLAEELPGDDRMRGESLKLKHRKFKISAKGIQFILGDIKHVPGVWSEYAKD